MLRRCSRALADERVHRQQAFGSGWPPAAHGEENGQPDIGQRPQGLRMPVTGNASGPVGFGGPGATLQRSEGKLRHRRAQGFVASAAETYHRPFARPGRQGGRSGQGLHGPNVAIAVPAVAQAPYHPVTMVKLLMVHFLCDASCSVPWGAHCRLE